MPTSPSTWRMCDAAAYENVRSELHNAIHTELAGGDSARIRIGASELLDLLWSVDGLSRSEIDRLPAQLSLCREDGQVGHE